jgi:hypothetical protein
MKDERMARECGKRLKPFGKTIKDATDFYIRHLKRKKSTGRKKGSGPFSGITANMDWHDARKRMSTQFNTKVVGLLEIACANPNLTDAELFERRKDDQVRLTPAQRAERIRKRDAPAKAYEKYIDTPEGRAEQDPKKRLANFYNKYPQHRWNPLNPAGKFTNAMAGDIWKEVANPALEEPNTRSLIDQQLATAEQYGLHKPLRNKKRQTLEQLVAEIYGFATKERAMDAIHDVATRLQVSLKKQARKR